MLAVDLTICYDLFLNNCDVDLQRKLESVKDLKNLGEKRVWQEVEQIFLESNPIYIRRVPAQKLKIIKGEGVSDYYQRLRNIYAEADMESATVGTHLICKLIASLPSEGNEGRIKEQLLKLFSELPNPKEEEMTKFISTIKENEAIVTAKVFRVQTGRGVARVQEEPQTEIRPHNLCGLVHKRGKCSQKCSGCGKYGSH